MHWRSYAAIGDVYYVIGDTIDYNGKKPGFAFTLAIISVTGWSLLLHLMRSIMGSSSVRGRLCASVGVAIVGSVLSYQGVLWFLRNTDWGTAPCNYSINDEGGQPICVGA